MAAEGAPDLRRKETVAKKIHDLLAASGTSTDNPAMRKTVSKLFDQRASTPIHVNNAGLA